MTRAIDVMPTFSDKNKAKSGGNAETTRAIDVMPTFSDKNKVKSSGTAQTTADHPAEESAKQRSAGSFTKKEGPTEKRGFFARAGDTVKGGVKGEVSSRFNAMTTLYDMGQTARDVQNRETLEECAHGLARARHDLEAMLSENQKTPGSWGEVDIQSQRAIMEDWQRKYEDAAALGQVQRQTVQNSYETADMIRQSSAENIERAKDGVSRGWQIMIDAGASMTQTLLDGTAGKLTGLPGSMIPFAVRAFGGGTQQARQDGADLQEQALYGTVSAAKEVFTEKMFNIALPFSKAYGGGALDDTVKTGIRAAVDRFAGTDTGKRVLGGVLTFGASAVSEGLEEFIGDWMEWQLPRLLYGGEVATAGETLENSLYDFLVGAASGTVGGLIDLDTYHYKLTDAAQSAVETAEETQNAQPETVSQATPDTAAEGTVEEMLKAAAAEMTAEAAEETRGKGLFEEPPLETSKGQGQQAPSLETLSMETEMRGTGSPEQTAENIRRVQREQAAFGENGAKALMSSYDGTTDPGTFYSGFAACYQAGVSGLTLEDANREYASQISGAQRFAAYAAGQNDAALSLQQEQQAAQYAKTAGKDSGLVYDDFVRETIERGGTRKDPAAGKGVYLTRETAERVNSVAKALGVRVRFVDSVRGGTANAQISGSDILVEKTNSNPVMFLVGHEMTHRMQELAPEQYRVFRETVAAEVQSETRVLLEQYQRAGENIRYEAALDEAAANYAGRMIENGEVLDDFIEQHRKDRTLLEKVRDAIRSLVAKLTGAEKRKAQTAAGKLTAALNAASEQAAALQDKADGATMGGTRNSLKDMTEGERTALLQYKSSESYKINAKLRDGTALTEAERKTVAALDDALEKLPVHEGTVYRRLSFDMEGQEVLDAFLAEHEVDTAVRNAAYTSSSTDIDGYPVSGELTVTQIISSKTGRDMAGIGNNNESEILFARNTRFYVENVEVDADGKTVIYMEEVTNYGAGQLHSEEYGQTMQQVQAPQGENDNLQKVPGVDTRRGADRRGLPGVRGEGKEEVRSSLKGSEAARELAQLQEENEQLKDRVEHWKGQLKRTTPKTRTVRQEDVNKLARRLVKECGGTLDAAAIQDRLQALGDFLVRGGDGKNELTWSGIHEKALDIARTLVENAVVRNDEMHQQYSDLRAYLRTAKLTISETDSHDIPDYNDFRKRNFGRMNVSGGATNMDRIYQELCAQWPEFFDEQMQSHPADQLLHIADVLDGLQPIYENPYSYDMEAAEGSVAVEILDALLGGEVRQTPPTYADRQAARLREQNQERMQRAIARERDKRTRQIKALKKRYAARDAKGRERRAARELRGKIIRHARALSQKLLHPSDRQHIPEDLRGAAAAMLESINLESQYSINEDGKRTKNGDGSPTRRTEAFRALKEQYAKITAEGGGEMVIDPALLGSDAEGIQGSFDAVIAMKDTRLADMSKDQLATVWQVVRAVEHSITTSGKVRSQAAYARTTEWAAAIQKDCSTRKAGTGRKKQKFLLDLATPYTFFSRFGAAGKAVYRMLRDAQDQQTMMKQRMQREVREIVSPKTVRQLTKATQAFTTERGAELTLSTAHVMELYELAKRKQAQAHLMKGGVMQPEIRSANIQRGTESILLSAADLEKITGTLTEEQRKIADGLQKLTSGILAEWGNQASMDAYGYRKFTEKDYWPIKAAGEGLHTSIEKGESNTRSIKNIGMAKTTTPHAGNALELRGLFSTFAEHTGDMIGYAAWLCPMEDANRLFNYRFRDAAGDLTGATIKGLLDRVGGSGAQGYWHDLMEDIQNGIRPRGDSALTSFFEKGIGSFKGAAVGANIRVVIQQPTAFFRAAAVLAPGDLAHGLKGGATKGRGWEKALKYAPIAMQKDMGGFDFSSPQQMSETLFDDRSRVRKLTDALSAPAGMADAVTWGALWNACEWATARDHQDLTGGSEAFYQETARLFTEVIDQTQVVDGVLQRSNIMRSSSALAQQATAFMGEPIMSLNLLMRTHEQWRGEQNAQKRAEAQRNFTRAVVALVVTNVVNALAQSIVDAMRDDDENKKYWERFLTAFVGITGDEERARDYLASALSGNLVDNLNPGGYIPYVKDGFSLARGYSVGRSDMEVVSDLIDAAKLLIQSAGGGTKTTAYSVKALLASAAKLFGIPVSNLTRDIWAFARSVAVETGNIPFQYEMEKAIYRITNSKNSSRYEDILYRALEQEDLDTYQHIRTDLMERMGLDGAQIDQAMRNRYKKAAEKPGYTLPQTARDLIGVQVKLTEEKPKAFSAEDLDSRAYQSYAAQRAETYRGVVDRLESVSVFEGLDAETRGKIYGAAYDLAERTALADNADGEYDLETKWMLWAVGGAAYGVDEAEAILFKAAYDTAKSDRDTAGKTISGSKKENTLELAVSWMPWLTETELNYLKSNYWKG